MENTLENKAKVINLYSGTGATMKCIAKTSQLPDKYLNGVMLNDHKERVLYLGSNSGGNGDFYDIEEWLLQLIPISSISDEDKAHLGLGHAISFDEYGYNYSIGGDSWDIDQVDYLRSKGYALPAFGLSVEELVNRGWIVLDS